MNNVKNRSSYTEVFCKKSVPKNLLKFTGKHLCQSIKKEALAQVFPYKFCKIFKNNFLYRTLPVAASVKILFLLLLQEESYAD